MLTLNVEVFPDSVQSYLLMSQTHLRLDDRAAAVQDLQRAVAIDPRNAALKRQLDELKRARAR